MKIRSIAGMALLAIGSAANASDFATSFSITEGLGDATASFTGLNLDINVGSRYLAANGTITTSNSISTGVTGTCFLTNGGGVFCNLEMARYSLVLDLGANLSGQVKLFDGSGTIVDTAPVTVISIQ